jgi:hypothetical protein
MQKMFTGPKTAIFVNNFRDEYDTDGVRLFRVRGAGEGQADFRAEQVSLYLKFIYFTLCIAGT